MVVQHNMQAMNANRMLNITTSAQAKSTEKLSSGYRINRAADDAAGLSISEKMRKQIKGLDKASSNAQDGISTVQTAEGALTEVHSMLQRMNELATQASNGTNSEADRQSIQDEISQLTTEIDRVAETTKFNETYLLKGGKQTTTKTLSAYDAGIKGTFVDSTDTATLTVDLKVGNTVSIAGQSYNIVESNDAEKGSDSLSKIQKDIKDITDNGATVTLDGTTYKYDSTNQTFDAGTGTVYSSEELSGKVKDGTKLSIDKDGNGTSETDCIVRNYSDPQNISAQDAATKITQALTQANNIGATTEYATVTPEGNKNEVSAFGTDSVRDDATATLKAGVTVMAKNSNDEFVEVTNDNILELAKSGATFYKRGSEGGQTDKIDLATDDKALSELLLVHKADSDQAGITVIAGGNDPSATALTTQTGKYTVATHQIQAAADYDIYEAVDLTDVADLTGVTTKASATLTEKASVTFEDIDTSDTEKAQIMVDGQNALNKALNGKQISMTYKDNAAAATFSHKNISNDEALADLDIAEDGVVSYKGVKVATLKSTDTNATTAGGVVTLGTATPTTVDAKYAQVDASDEYTFTINKGKTTVAEDLVLNLHVGADADMTNKISVGIAAMDSKGLGISGINVADDSGVAGTYAIDAIEDAIKTVSAQRSSLGAVQNRLEHTIANLDNVVENTTSAESSIRDTDMATEMVNFSKNNILAQAGQSMLAQANQSNQGVLSLLG